MLEFNIAPNTQIGRINIWNPTRAIYSVPETEEIEIEGKKQIVKPFPVRGLINGRTYYLRSDNEDNPYIDVYDDPKYKNFLVRLYTNPKGVHESPFIKRHWKIQEHKIYSQENSFNTDHYMRAGEYIENLVSDNIVEFSKRWLGLGGFKELTEDMQEYYSKYFTSYSTNGWYGFAHYYPETDTLVECPVIDMGNKKAIPAIKFSNEPERPFTLYRSAKNSNIDLSSYGGNNGH
jgi:hypothetical protein